MSQFKVYTETGIHSVAFDDLKEAKEWAREANCWFEIVDLVACDVIFTQEDQEQEDAEYYGA